MSAPAPDATALLQVDGRCHCGQIRYSARVDPASASLCHCSDCQMMTGSAYRATVRARAPDFRLLSGSPTRYVKTADSGTRRLHAFCPACGTPVYSCAPTDPDAYSLRIGCLAQRHQLPPQRQIWCDSALAWSADLGGLTARGRQ